MSIKKKSKIIISIIVVIMILILVLLIKLNSTYVFDIGTAFYKTIYAPSANFKLSYESNYVEKIDAEGEIQYSFEDLELAGNVNINGGSFVVKISKDNSTVAYYIEELGYWVTVNATDFVAPILELLDSTEKSGFGEFPIKELLQLVKIDNVVDISEYPNKLSMSFMIKLLNNNYVEEIVECNKEKEGNITTYYMKPNMYKLLKEFIETSELDEEKNEILKDLEKNKEGLENIEIEVRASIDKEGYLTKLVYIRKENDETERIDLELTDFDDINLKLKNEVRGRLKITDKLI